jgi:hypothetical protein
MISLETSCVPFLFHFFPWISETAPRARVKYVAALPMLARASPGEMAIEIRELALPMSEPRELVEHFFRHEFGRLVAVLTRSLGVRRFGLVGHVGSPVFKAGSLTERRTGSRSRDY